MAELLQPLIMILSEIINNFNPQPMKKRIMKFRVPIYKGDEFSHFYYFDRDFLNKTSISGFSVCSDRHMKQPQMFTGLTEISLNERGKDIYENDEIEWNIFPYDNVSGEKTGETARVKDIVKFSSGCFKLEKRGGLLCTILEPHRGVIIIGNIHQPN